MLLSVATSGRLVATRCPRMAGPCRCVPPLQPLTAQHHPRRMACAAGRDGDKSWGEIAADAGKVAMAAISKVKDTAASAVSSLVKQKPAQPPDRARREDLRPEALASGLLGRAVLGLLGGAVRSLERQVERAASQTRGVADAAAARLRASDAVRRRLGAPVTVGPPISQSTSSSSINGVQSQRVVLLLPVYGQDGRGARAQVTCVTGPDGRDSTTIVVQLSSGESFTVGDGDGGGGARRSGGGGAHAPDVVEAEFVDLGSGAPNDKR